jgi:predicted RNase H-like nuclease (RuvC/YqgF family)
MKPKDCDVEHRKIEPGEKEIVLASEEVTRRNMQAAVEHGNETRRMVQLIEERVEKLERTIHAQNQLIAQYQTQLASLQQQFYQAGSTSYAHPKDQ